MSSSSSSTSLSDQLSTAGHENQPNFRDLNYMAIRYASHGCHEMAMTLCNQALEKFVIIPSSNDNPEVEMILNTLAAVYHYQSKYKEATELLHEALTVGEDTLGENHPIIADTLNNLAVLYGRRNKHKEAEAFCRRALDIRERIHGKHHPDVAKQLNNLALLCQNQNKYEEAANYFRRALEIYEKMLGSKDANVAKTENFLASCYAKQNSYEDADNLEVNDLSERVSTEQDSLQTNPEIMVEDCSKEKLDVVDDNDDGDKLDLQIPENADIHNEEMHEEEKVDSSTFNEKTCSMPMVQSTLMPKELSSRHVAGPSGIKEKIFRILGIRKKCTSA